MKAEIKSNGIQALLAVAVICLSLLNLAANAQQKSLTWNPDRGEIVDEEGNVTEEISSSDMGGLTINDGGEIETDGGPHTPGGMHEGGSSDWNVNEGNPQKPGVSGGTGGGTGYDGEGPWVNIGGERWYIFQLTDHILIIYRIYDGYIIIYYYYVQICSYNCS